MWRKTLLALALLLGLPTVASAACTESTAFLARTSGLDALHQTAYTDLICGLVTDGVFAKLDGLYMLAAADSTTARLNLVSTSYGLTVNGSATFAVDQGYTGAASAYISTGFNPTTAVSPNLTQNSISGFYWSNTSAQKGGPGLSDNAASGTAHTVSSFGRFIDDKSYFAASDVGGAQINVVNTDGKGMYTVNRADASTIIGYKNGVQTVTGSVTSAAPPNVNIELLAQRMDNSYFTGIELAAGFGGSLTPTEIAAEYSRVHDYIKVISLRCALTTLSVGPPKVVACTDTAAETITVPSDWNPGNNSIEVIGSGGGGAVIDLGGGGGGGAYSKTSNVSLTQSSVVSIQVGKAPIGQIGPQSPRVVTGVGPGQDSYVCNSTANCASISGSAVVVGAKGGTDVHNLGGTAGGAGGAGGAAASGVGSTKVSGGNGGSAAQGIGTGGGGGAGGPFGAGANGGDGYASCGFEPTGCGNGGGGGGGGGTAGANGTVSDGGAGGNNHSGTGGGAGEIWSGVSCTLQVAGTAGGGSGGVTSKQPGCQAPPSGVFYQGSPGGNGTEWDATHGSGGGAGGETSFTQGDPGSNGGLYGGGGGGGNSGAAASGIIMMTYSPGTVGYGLLLGR